MEGLVKFDLESYKDKKILITGHTGFKGSWMCKVLTMHGANVLGYSLKPATQPNLFELLQIENKITHVIGDIRNLELLKKIMNEFQPEIVVHMAAQPLVRESYINPVYTFDTNIMGTVNICEAVRNCHSVRSFINVTTDKVYENKEWEWGYRECDRLNGFDPYSNSKSCSELVTSSYIKSFFAHIENLAVSTCRAGNVIGGGDFSKDRIIPDCIRSASNKLAIKVRNPKSIRPYQHVLEPVVAYLNIAMKMYEDKKYAGSYNIGPYEYDCISTESLVKIFCEEWQEDQKWSCCGGKEELHEANLLKLDISKIKRRFGIIPRWDIKHSIKKTIDWAKAYNRGDDINQIMEKQVMEYLEG